MKIIIVGIIIGIVLLYIKGKKIENQRYEEEYQRDLEEAAENRRIYKEKQLENTRGELATIERVNINISKGKILKRQHLKDMPEIKFKKITKSFNKNTLTTFVVLDVETTGLYASKDRIVELSAIFYEDFRPISCFTTLINPGIPIPEEASQVNNIHDEDVEGAPTIGEVSDALISYVGSCPVVAYNASFDLKFLYCSGIDFINSKNPLYDVYEISKKAYKDLGSYKLENVAHNIDVYYDAHSSLDDCFATGAVFEDAIESIT